MAIDEAEYRRGVQELHTLANKVPKAYRDWMHGQVVEFKEATKAARVFLKNAMVRRDSGKLHAHLVTMRRFHDQVR